MMRKRTNGHLNEVHGWGWVRERKRENERMRGKEEAWKREQGRATKWIKERHKVYQWIKDKDGDKQSERVCCKRFLQRGARRLGEMESLCDVIRPPALFPNFDFGGSAFRGGCRRNYRPYWHFLLVKFIPWHQRLHGQKYEICFSPLPLSIVSICSRQPIIVSSAHIPVYSFTVHFLLLADASITCRLRLPVFLFF